jgi:co-chaperonin GroES (HSP10)
MLNIRPLNAKVIVRLVDPPGRAGLLFLPETARGRTQRGVVVAAGPGRAYPSRQAQRSTATHTRSGLSW